MDSPIQPGRALGKYRVVSALGAGGMGVVYRARDERLGRDVALKVLPAAQTADPVAKARMLREAQTASSLGHPYICHIYEVGEAEGHTFIAMELVDGRPLSASIPAGGMPIDVVIRYGEQMAEALDHAHSRGVLHRDIKSSNVVVTPEGRIKILDFGLAKRVTEDIANEATLSQVSPLTQAGSIAGTLGYLAPEVLSGQPADARSDLWALGVVLYEMANGALPFQGRTSFEVSSAILRESSKALPPRVPPGLRAVIQRCLAKEPAQRYQRASEVRAALEAIGSAATQPVPVSVPAPAFAPPEPGRPAWGNWALVGATVLVAGFLVWKNFFVPQVGTPGGNPATPGVNPASAFPAPPPNSATAPQGRTGGKPSGIPDANEYFQRALLFLQAQFDPPHAKPLIEKALEIDPKFAEARATLALVLALQVESGASNESAWIYKAEQEARRAITDDPECATAHGVLAMVYFFQGRSEEALRSATVGMNLNPHNVGTLFWRTRALRYLGDPNALELNRQATLQDLTFFPLRWTLGSTLFERGDAEGGIRELSKVLDQDAANHFVICEFVYIYTQRGELKTARKYLERLRPEQMNNYRVRLVRALLLAAEGKRRDAQKEMDAQILKYAEICPAVTLMAAEYFSLQDDVPQALTWLERAVRNGDERVQWFAASRLLGKVRENPRFKEIVDSIAFRRSQKQ